MEFVTPERRMELVKLPCQFCSYGAEQGVEMEVINMINIGVFPCCTLCKDYIIRNKLGYGESLAYGKKVKERRDELSAKGRPQSELKHV